MIGLKDVFGLFVSKKGESGIPARKELPVGVGNQITVFTYVALPLNVILAYDRFQPWFLEHFIRIYARFYINENNNPEFRLEYFDRHSFSEVLDFTVLREDLMREVRDIIDFVTGKINEGYYLIIYLDENFLAEKNYYRKRHVVHPSLVYGYNLETGKILAIGFNNNNVCTNIGFGFEEFARAYQKGKPYYRNREYAPYIDHDAAVKLLKAKEPAGECSFRIEKFLTELDHYLHSTGDLTPVTAPAVRLEQGFRVYEVLVDQIEKMVRGEVTVKYHNFYLLAEHKKTLYKRLQYILSRYRVSESLRELVSGYARVVKRFEVIKLKYLRQVLSENEDGNFYRKIKDKSVFKELVEMINTGREEEERLTREIYLGLKEIKD